MLWYRVLKVTDRWRAIRALLRKFWKHFLIWNFQICCKSKSLLRCTEKTRESVSLLCVWQISSKSEMVPESWNFFIMKTSKKVIHNFLRKLCVRLKKIFPNAGCGCGSGTVGWEALKIRFLDLRSKNSK